MSDSILVRVTLGSYDFAHPSEKHTQVYVQIPEVARASWLLPSDVFHGLKDRAWPEVLDVTHDFVTYGGAASNSSVTAAWKAVMAWLRDDANRDEMQAAYELDQARRSPITRKLLAENGRLRARVAELEAERVALRNDALSMRGSLAPADGDRKVPFELGGTLAPAVDWLVDRVSELEARLAEYERPADEDPIAYTLTEKATARPGMQPAIRTDAPDFFQPGHTYSSTIFGGPFTVDYVGTNPGSGERYAHGWIHHEHDDSWAPNVVTGLFERFIDITRGGDA